MPSTQQTVALQIMSSKSHPWMRTFKSPLRPLIRDERELDSRRAQSQAVADIVYEVGEKHPTKKES